VQAAIEIRDFIAKRKTEGGDFDVRIGVHSGPLVAGIVGIKKFAYDIWGDTVNMAARMEQNSAQGKINISDVTYQLIKNDFHCIPRGKIFAKNKGEIDMYFVESISTLHNKF
jgi:class 3 adenylate cyclase